MLKKNFFLFFLFFSIIKNVKNETANHKNFKSGKVAIIGAGPAGITVVGLLIDLGVNPDEIIWIDPFFNVGRIGEYYENVPGNAKNKLYIDFLKSCEVFKNINTESIQKLYSSNLEEFGHLSIIINPLQDITNYLLEIVKSVKENVLKMEYFDESWKLETKNFSIEAENVILAIGAKPKILDYPVNNNIPLDYALDPETLKKLVKPNDIIAVVGSSHSAILVLKFLTEANVKKIINFYKHPITYAVDMGTWISNSANGLKGIAAVWAQEILEKNLIPNLIRLKNTKENLDNFLPECNKIIYAIGYEMNNLPNITVNGENFSINQDPEKGIIGPNLFGIGIAFPGYTTNPFGEKEKGIGLNSFMKYAQTVMTSWIKKNFFQIEVFRSKRKALKKFDELFFIEIL